MRPWILLPKVIAVALYLGAMASALVMWIGGGMMSLGATDPRRLLIINLVSRLMTMLAIPALLLAIMLGVLLLMQFPGVFLRMRWLQVKLATLVVFIPSAHLFLSSRLKLCRQAFMQRQDRPELDAQFMWGLVGVIVVSIWVVVLARLKPRLGQNWARAYGAAGVKSGIEAGRAD